jgi:Na+/H+ antiporter NhaC
MSLLINLLPILLFVFVYVGSSLYFAWQGLPNAFYQLAPTVAILPALIAGWILHKGSTKKRMDSFLDGISHRDIITMCIIFLLAGAFSTVTKSIGSVDSTVNLILSLVDSRFLLIGVFIAAAFISTAIGTSMGTIATLAPLALGLAQQDAFSIELGMATVVGGAMFGDNLSLISDTTIAAVMSQEADFAKKLKLNAFVATIAASITMLLLFGLHNSQIIIQTHSSNLLLITPYLLLITLALRGVNVFSVLVTSTIFAGIVGFITSSYTLFAFSHDIAVGFNSMYDIMLLSMLVGGLSGLTSSNLQQLTRGIEKYIHRYGGQKLAQIFIAAIVSVLDILLANNTIAIIFSGQMVKDIAHYYKVPPHYSAAWLDIFSCVFQGIIPYGAQILLASSIGGISPLAIIGHVYYCYILGAVTMGYILFNKKLTA